MSIDHHPLEDRLTPLTTRRSRALEGPNGERWRLEIEREPPDYIARNLPAGALIFANDGTGNHLFLASDSSGVHVYWHEGPQIEPYCGALEDLLPNVRRPPTTHPPITYRGTTEVVKLGDRVKVRYWLFFKGEGRITYVPGVSPLKRTLERDGLAWVRITLDHGTLVDSIVMPDGALQRSVVLLARHPGDESPSADVR